MQEKSGEGEEKGAPATSDDRGTPGRDQGQKEGEGEGAGKGIT